MTREYFDAQNSFPAEEIDLLDEMLAGVKNGRNLSHVLRTRTFASLARKVLAMRRTLERRKAGARA